MNIGKIILDIANTEGLDDQDLISVENYLKNRNDINSVNELIEVITTWELTLNVSRGFEYASIYRRTSFFEISREEFEEFKEHRVFDINTTFEPGQYYTNFLFKDFHVKDEKFYNIKTKEYATTEDGAIPCLIHIKENIMTYYIFWWIYDEHRFEIDDRVM